MVITIDIPDRYAKRNLYVFAGLEPVLRSRVKSGVRGPWEVKVSDCCRCGKCCEAIRADHVLGTDNGCRYLRRSPGEQLCGLGVFRPFGCAIAELDVIPTCTVKWEAIE